MDKNKKEVISRYVVTCIAGFIPYLFLAYLSAKLLQDNTFFWIVIIGLPIFYFVVWLFKSIVVVILFPLLWKNKLIDETYIALVKDKFPNPWNYSWGIAEDYFLDVCNDERLDYNIRLKARKYRQPLQMQSHFKAGRHFTD